MADSPLTAGDRLALKAIATIPCITPGCACGKARRDVADNLRLVCPAINDATLAHIVLAVVANITRYVLTREMTTAYAAGALLSSAALELAANDLEAPNP